MITIIMIYHVLFSILIKETLSKFRRLSPESALQVICFCQHPLRGKHFVYVTRTGDLLRAEGTPI